METIDVDSLPDTSQQDGTDVTVFLLETSLRANPHLSYIQARSQSDANLSKTLEERIETHSTIPALYATFSVTDSDFLRVFDTNSVRMRQLSRPLREAAAKDIELIRQACDIALVALEELLQKQAVLRNITIEELNWRRHFVIEKYMRCKTAVLEAYRRKLTELRGMDRAVNARKGPFTYKVTAILRMWMLDHLSDPYPTEYEKFSLCRATGLTGTQLDDWFTNNRGRLWKALVAEVQEEKSRASASANVITSSSMTTNEGSTMSALPDHLISGSDIIQRQSSDSEEQLIVQVHEPTTTSGDPWHLDVPLERIFIDSFAN